MTNTAGSDKLICVNKKINIFIGCKGVDVMSVVKVEKLEKKYKDMTAVNGLCLL